MKNFIEICQLDQKSLKEYLNKYLNSNKYETKNEKGFLYAKGDIPVMLIAHMDTVHEDLCKDVVDDNGKISSPQGIGGDDRCGIFMIMNIIKEMKCSVLFCEDEEIGLVGAYKFAKTDYVKNLGVNYMIEFDRRGNNDAVFYSCGNKEFKDFILKESGYKFAIGSCSDISAIMPASKLCAVNFSCGYYKAHTKEEYVIYEEMMNTIEMAKNLIKKSNNIKEPFKYEVQSYSYNNTYTDGQFDYYESILEKERFEKDILDMARDDVEIELEVEIVTKKGKLDTIYSYGSTKTECWMNMFFDHPKLCAADIENYSWS